MDKISKKQSSIFRFVYNNIPNSLSLYVTEYNTTKALEHIIREKYGVSVREAYSIVSDAFTFYKSNLTDIAQKKKDIEKFKKYVEKLHNEDKNKKNICKVFKLNKKIAEYEESLKHDVVFGGKVNLQKISYLNNYKDKDVIEYKNSKKVNVKDSIKGFNDQFHSNRDRNVYMVGDKEQKGNSAFDFHLTDNKIVYKPYNSKKDYITFDVLGTSASIKDIVELQGLMDNKILPVTVRATSDSISLTYDDTILSGYRLDKEKLKKEKKGKSEEEKKEIYKKFCKELEDNKLKNKLDYRFCGIDLNPGKIGCMIMDYTPDTESNYKEIFGFELNLDELLIKPPKEATSLERVAINNSQKNAIRKAWKVIFDKLEYYKVGYLILEKLDIKPKPNSDNSTEMNRKVFNCWHKTLHQQCIVKHCNRIGLISKDVNPAYSSFIGNMLFNYTDSVNAAAEIARRGMIFVYNNKNVVDRDDDFSWYPIFCTGTMDHTISRLRLLNRNRKTIDVDFFKDVQDNWIDIYRKVKESGFWYRVTKVMSSDSTEFKPSFKSPIFRYNHLFQQIFVV